VNNRDLPPELHDALAAEPEGDALRAIWHELPRAQASPESAAGDTAQRDAAWARLQARLADPARKPSPDDDTPVVPLHSRAVTPDARRVRAAGWMNWAAVALLTVLGGGTALWRGVPVTIEAPVGGAVLDTVLADGSRLTLAPGSRARVSRALGAASWLRPGVRRVALDGNGFFAVARDGRPFEVTTNDAVVTVLGTRFAVRSPVAGAGSRVSVEEGRVAVTPLPVAGRAPTSRGVLSAGDVALVRNGAAVLGRLPEGRPVAEWRSGGLAAVDEPLAVVLAEVARRFGVEITLDEAARAVGAVSVFYPEAPDAATIVADLSTAHGLRFTRTSRGFAVTGRADAP
jgi:ferric-dicitrate binding protein FerR (iron transport regulator)